VLPCDYDCEARVVARQSLYSHDVRKQTAI
jgi:hypothetical protein